MWPVERYAGWRDRDKRNRTRKYHIPSTVQGIVSRDGEKHQAEVTEQSTTKELIFFLLFSAHQQRDPLK